MSFPSRVLGATLLTAVLAFAAGPSLAQNSEAKPGDKASQAADTPKDAQRRGEEFAEAAKTIEGPAGNAECVWLGRRVVGLLWRDDMDTAFRHLDLYDRFGCPGPHIQATFRCVVQQGSIDPKAPETLSARVHACWLNPGLATAAAAPATTSASNPAPGGTSAR